MAVEIISSGDKIKAFLSGELDHHSAKDFRTEIDFAIANSPVARLLEIDFSQVGFMDSSGIGLVMGRFKIMSERGGRVVVLNPPPPIARVMQVAGLGRLVGIKHTSKPEGPQESLF